MTLRSKIALYFVFLHLVLAAAAVLVFFESRLLLFVVEALFATSVAISYRLVSALFVPLDLIETGAELIGERDFGSRFVSVGQPEMDRLIEVYNSMIGRLREERLIAQERYQLLDLLVQASPSGIVICDFDGSIERMNPVAEQLTNPEVVEQLRSMRAGESRLLNINGARRLKAWRAEFRDRSFVKTFYLLEELTEELRLSERAAYEKLIRMMSHEVNNSVGAVRSLLESLVGYGPQIGEADREDFSSAVEIASARMDSLNRFMAAFADVVRIPPPVRAPIRIGPIVEDMARLLRPELERREIRLEIRVEADREIEGDRRQLEQAVLNILRNAMESIDHDGEVIVTLRDGTLFIADNGKGIRDEARDDLFTPFFTTRPDGRGLGLTIVQEILTAHGFGFSLQNREAGGAEFRIAMT